MLLELRSFEADILLDAEVKLGEMLKKIDKKDSYTGFQKRNSVLPEGVTKKQSHEAQEKASVQLTELIGCVNATDFSCSLNAHDFHGCIPRARG